MRIGRVDLVAVAVAACSIPLFSQGPSQFKSSVHAVEVDLRVFDRQGRFVEDLTPEDIEVFESGDPQQLRSVVLVNGRQHTAATKPNPANPSPHLWVFFIDYQSICDTVTNFNRARSGLRTFIEHHFPEGDLGGIVYLDRLISDRFTSVRKQLLRDVEQMVMPTSESPVQPRSGGKSDSLDTLDRLLSGLSRVRGPKTLVLMSDGVSAEAGPLRRVIRKAIGAGVRVYGVDTRGVPLEGGFPSDGLTSLAADTGGEVLFWHNNLRSALLRVAIDTSTYYVLAYEPRNLRFDGKFRAIQIRVKRPDVTVRARKGYFAIDPALMSGAEPLPARR